MPSTYLLQQMVVDHTRKQVGKGLFSHLKGTPEELLSIPALEKVELENPSKIREYIEEALYRVEDLNDQRYTVARKLYDLVPHLPKAYNALIVILSTL